MKCTNKFCFNGNDDGSCDIDENLTESFIPICAKSGILGGYLDALQEQQRGGERTTNSAMDAIADLNDALAYIRCSQSGNAVSHIHAAINCLQQHQ